MCILLFIIYNRCDNKDGLYHSCYPVFTDEGELSSCIYIEGVDPTELEGLDTLVEIFSGCLSSLQSVEKEQNTELKQYNKMVKQFNSTLLKLQSESEQQKKMINDYSDTVDGCHREISRWKCCFNFNNALYEFNTIKDINNHLQPLLLDTFFTDHVQMYNII